ncbi:MAG: DUF2807 domain-containing protein [Flavobacteriales bacterium]|nr:DUF2807 domain-containing protein [Flavobacteriales bacterium]MBP9080799.1 DUF2807 domain-containing protein [Flavobacteriales bacterium]
MNTPDKKDALLAPLRELPVEVSLQQVEHMVAAFPAAMGAMAWLLHTVKFNLNTLIMTSIGTLLLGTGIFVLSLDTPRQPPLPSAPRSPVTAQTPPTADHGAATGPVAAPQATPAAEVPAPAAAQPADVATAAGPVSPHDPAPEPAAPATPVIAAPAPAAHVPPEKPTPQGHERVFNLSGFTGIALMASVDVLVEEGEFSVVAIGTPELLDRLELDAASTLLTVGMSGNWSFKNGQEVTVKVRLPKLDQLIVQGSGDINVAPLTRSQSLDLTVMGSGDIHLTGTGNLGPLTINVAGSGDVVCGQVVSQSTVINVTGSGDAQVDGRTEHLNVHLAGSGDVKAEGLDADQGLVHLAGSGDVFVGRITDLTLAKEGSGEIHTTGGADQAAPVEDGDE